MASGKTKLIVGNWKMYIDNVQDARALINAVKRKSKTLSGVEVWVAPPAPFIPLLAQKSSPITIGAQTVSSETEGPHTGQVSAAMLKEAGATFVIVGHSERRSPPAGGGESDATINQELKYVFASGMTAILCIGEHARDERGGHYEFIAGQLRSALEGVSKQQANKLVVAYEPVWAIGHDAADAAKPELIRETVIFIRKTLVELMERSTAMRIPILYGGSVEGENAGALLESSDIAGFLVGHASANEQQFLEIIAASVGSSSKSPDSAKATSGKQNSHLRRGYSGQAKSKRKKISKKRR